VAHISERRVTEVAAKVSARTSYLVAKRYQQIYPPCGGSPVFTKDWKSLPVRHYGGDAVPRLDGATGTYQAHEGKAIESVQQTLGASVPKARS